MGFLSRFFGENDPTADWPVGEAQAPLVNLERQAIETFSHRLPFGAPLDAARFLGRPERFAGRSEVTFSLMYDRWGMDLEFENSALYQVSFLIGDIHRSERRPALKPAEPRGPDGLTLSPRTTHADLLQRFGEPGDLQDLEETVIFYYSAGPLVSEFEVRGGFLTGWDVYVD
jgi:hypothetical protein